MNRFASQLIFCSPHQILRRTVVEQDENKMITNLIPFDSQVAETSNTLFYDGILSAGITSLKQSLTQSDLAKYTQYYQYIDIKNGVHFEVNHSEKPFILDFGTTDVDKINPLLSKISGSLATFTIFEIIAACVYYPAIILGKPAELSENFKTDLILWKNIDLVNKKITNLSKLINLSNFVNS